MMLSSTRIKSLLTCPRQFRYAYLDEIPALPSLPLVFGQVIHDVIHRTHDRALERGESLEADFALAEFARLWPEALSQHGPLPNATASEQPDYPALAQTMLAGYVSGPLSRQEPLVLEVAFELEWHGHQVCGIIDRIDQTDQGLVIIDYKSGKKKPSPRELEADLQLTIYAWAAELLLEEPVVEVIYYFLRQQLPLPTCRTDSDFRQLEDVTLPRVVETITRGDYPPHYGYWCRFCDYRELCAAEDAVAMPGFVPV